MEARNIPEQIKRGVRQEANFGCVICGCPIIDYHHIEPYHIVKKHDLVNLVLLCPTHHRRANNGEIPPELIHEFKKAPFNASSVFVSESFFISSYSKLKFIIGTNTFSRTPNIITCAGKTILSVYPTENDYALINAEFYDKDKLIAEIKENEWHAYKNPSIWDIQYSPGHLKINKDSGDVLLDFKVNNYTNVVELKAKMKYKDYLINLSPSRLLIKKNGNELPMTFVSKYSVFTDCEGAISI
ncbi:trigger factor [Paenibacillus xylanexedens]|uniref:HNH endonuclease n=1 Tax=Paenibacillus xylanexedens TaxID=528191 RepID=UPI0020A0C1BB|nr:HNH endonuclease signature motif containing protein [Paenibacillus xylanexedens]MCP1425452.1 trigger factor [Paenibacillus xylanexedens]